MTVLKLSLLRHPNSGSKPFPQACLASPMLLAPALLAGAVFGLTPAAQAQSAEANVPTDTASAHEARIRMDMHDMGPGSKLHLTVGHSMVLHSATNIRRIFIGNPAVLQSFTGGPNEIVLTAKTSGISSLVIWDTQGQSCLYTFQADTDAEALQQSMTQAYPKSAISVEGREGRIFLSGTAPSQDAIDNAGKLALSYSKEVVNSLRVMTVHGKQVQLKLRIVEVDRNKAEQYGANIFSGNSKVPFNLTTGQFPSTATVTPGTAAAPASGNTPATAATAASAVVTDALNLFLYSSKLNLGTTIKDLESKQILQVLAEPTLTAISGQPAKFLSGGEFPFPVVQGGTGSAVAVTITFRPYGVKVDFTPTVNEDGTIRLKVAPEVSTLDFSNAVTISGFTIPALSTRRAETEVEIQSGQTFALTGLLDHRTTESLSSIPGITNLPFIGKYFISKSYTRSLVELVVLVTASVIDPLTDLKIAEQPQMPLPDLDVKKFDHDLGKEQRIPAKPWPAEDLKFETVPPAQFP